MLCYYSAQRSTDSCPGLSLAAPPDMKLTPKLKVDARCRPIAEQAARSAACEGANYARFRELLKLDGDTLTDLWADAQGEEEMRRIWYAACESHFEPYIPRPRRSLQREGMTIPEMERSQDPKLRALGRSLRRDWGSHPFLDAAALAALTFDAPNQSQPAPMGRTIRRKRRGR